MPETNDVKSKVENALRISYEYCNSYMKDAYYCLSNYNNEIDPRIWGTLSECPIPMAYSNVETMLPTVMDFLFGSPKPFMLLNNEGMNDEAMRKLEKFIIGKVLYEMNVRQKVKPILRDALIMPCGYGIVEQSSITPPQSSIAIAMSPDGDIESQAELIASSPVKVPNLRYLDFFSVFPSPTGGNPDDADWTIVIDFMDEFTIRQGLKDGVLHADFEELKKESRTLTAFSESALHYARYVYDYQNPRLPHEKQNQRINLDADLPLRIPVIKYYGKDEHIWLSGNQTIFRRDKKQIMGSPVVRFCAQQIGDTWYPRSVVQYSLDMYNLINAWYNSVIDILSHYLYPVTVVNKSMVLNQEQDVSYQPNLMIETTGDPARAIHYPQMPPIPPAMLEFPREIRSLLDTVNGTPEAVKGAGGVGIVRGGNNALQSLMQRASARVIGMAEELEHTGMKPVYEKTIYMLQMIGDGRVTYLNELNERVTETVTQEEIRQAIGVQVLGKKRMENKYADQLIKAQTMPTLLQMGFDPVKVLQWTFPEQDVDELVGAIPPNPAGLMEGGSQGGMGVENQMPQMGGQQGGMMQ